MTQEARMKEIEILTTSDAARELKRSPDRVRDYARNGKLPALRTRSGQRLFKADDVERLAFELNGRKEAGR
jgi:excisionase family DNA binding protein